MTRDRALGIPLTIWWFLGGFTPYGIVIPLWLLGSLRSLDSRLPSGFAYFIVCLMPLFCLVVSPYCFTRGARLAWKEEARVSRWLNLFGLAVCLGLILTLVITITIHTP